MKKAIRIAAMLAAAGMICAAMPVQPASAQIWTLVGSETETAFQDMIPLDDKGMLNFSGSDASYQVYMQYITDYYDKEVTDPETGEIKIERVYFDNCRLYVVSPRMNALHFTLRSDKPEAEQLMLEIMDQYYPEISTTYQQRVPNDYASLDPCFGVLMDGTIAAPHLYELRDKTEQAGSPERSDSIMHDLAEAGLITEFYTWGQSAYCQQYFGWMSYAADGFDKEQVERYLTEHAPNCALKENHYETDYIEWSDYQITPDESMSFAEQFALVADLYEATGIRPTLSFFFDTPQLALGQNALAFSGDVTLDCAVDVSDAVLLARFCTEDSTAVITDQGKQNADVNGSGNIDLDDVTAILRKIAKLD